ncbi:VanZ family protein [candidate division TA06 bacterium]|nr:VanZ family protein [candidate division TA06 bacterium]
MTCQILGALLLMVDFSPSFHGDFHLKEDHFSNSFLPANFLKGEATLQSKGADLWFSQDKAMHLTTSVFLTGLSYRVYHDEYRNPKQNSRLFATTFTALLGIGKEVYDSTTPTSNASWKDLTADGLGILLGLFLFTSTFN